MNKEEEYLPIWIEKKYGGSKDIGDWTPEDVVEIMESYHQSELKNMTTNLTDSEERKAYLIGIEHGKKIIESRVNAISDDIKRSIRNLKFKHKSFLGTKGEVSRQSFKSGLIWGIDSLEDILNKLLKQ